MNILARTCNYDLMNNERIAARVFVALGGLVWFVLTLGAAVVYPSGIAWMDQYGPILVLVLSIGALLVGWFFENLAAVLLFAGAVATVAWGVVAGWEPGVWGLMSLFLIAPEVISGVLFLAAASMQKVCGLDSAG